jgi:hypothetical protein
MPQLTSDLLWSSFRVVLALENRSQQIDAAVAALKTTLSNHDGPSLPTIVGLTDELRWHLEQSLRQLESFERAVGVTRREQASRPRNRATAYSLRGSTQSLCLPDLIGLLHTQRKTGTLWIKSPDERFVLELLNGAVVHAMSDRPRPDQRLGTVLVAQNKLSTEKLEQFLSQHRPENGKIGELLTRAKLVSEDDLRNALEWQVRELFHRISSSQNAVFCFREGAISKLEQRVCLNTTQLLLESAQAQDERIWEEERLAGDPAAEGTAEAGDAPCPQPLVDAVAQPAGGEPSTQLVEATPPRVEAVPDHAVPMSADRAAEPVASECAGAVSGDQTAATPSSDGAAEPTR